MKRLMKPYRLQAYLAATEEHNVVQASAEAQQEWNVKMKLPLE